MSQRKKQGYQRTTAVPTSRTGLSSRTVYRHSEENSRRRVTFAILAVGLIVAASVLLVSLGSKADTTNSQSPSQQQGQTTDTKALEAKISTLTDQLQKNPTDTSYMVELGNTYYDAGRYSEAIPWYEKALEAIPSNTNVRTDLGTAYFYSGNVDKAKEVWFKSLEYDPNKIQTHYNLAVLYSHLTPPDTDNAIKEYQTVIQIDPNSEQAKNAQTRLQDLGKK